MNERDIKHYIRFVADRRLNQLGLEGIYKIPKNPLPWLDEILNAPEHTNFFENRVLNKETNLKRILRKNETHRFLP